ncbi:MAG: NUDIX hydrolase [Fibrobacteres bacterium]|nr:NUDIX hydrolase [Fibrobacterota bacterium]
MTTLRERAAALVIEGETILLVRHCKKGQSYYLLPGGGIEKYETAEDAIVRELREETGLTAAPEECVFISETISPDGNRKIRQYVHLCTVSGSIGKSIDPMVAEALFMPLSEFEKVKFYPNIRQHILDGIKNGFPIEPEKMTIPWE